MVMATKEDTRLMNDVLTDMCHCIGETVVRLTEMIDMMRCKTLGKRRTRNCKQIVGESLIIPREKFFECKVFRSERE
jgi:hypothetical protein